MNSRERFDLCTRHNAPDRVPLDMGATSLTGMDPDCREQLRQVLGFTSEGTSANNNADERVLQWAGTDFRSVGSIVHVTSPHTRKVSDTARIDDWGIQRDKIDGQWQITHSPLQGASIDDLKSYPFPSPIIDDDHLAEWVEQAKTLREQDRYVVIAEHPVYGILELGCWMCGYEEFMIKLIADPDFVRCFFDRVLEFQIAIIDQYYGALGPHIDLTLSGDDFGTQMGPLISPDMFRDLVAPRFSERIRRTKELAHCLYWHHSCGAITPLLDQIIGCGVDILNPVQTSAQGMDPETLKQQFGDRLIFWGAVDVQQFLPNATPNDIRHGVRDLADALGKDGGYVMAPAHVMARDIPPENIIAWIETIR